MQVLIVSISAPAFLRSQVGGLKHYEPARGPRRSCTVSARPPVDLFPTRLKSSRGRKNTRPVALTMRATRRLKPPIFRYCIMPPVCAQHFSLYFENFLPEKTYDPAAVGCGNAVNCLDLEALGVAWYCILRVYSLKKFQRVGSQPLHEWLRVSAPETRSIFFSKGYL